MANHHLFVKLRCGLLFAAAGFVGVAMAADKDAPKTDGKISGLLIDK
jgi:hypothetical protein